ncbi:PREDICTED: origin recognition complex subunit 2-like [Amphimedon queenslandica]|uniref:Origin recognition complex subunit 2 n=1 Tax=Amphimedon queenslandica TaxID=400682 RepID=A0A1X7V8F8_AMPQE|nr:PREDICTED: origin recognition complex subunit 2-like [Amphimedon queenslandica]|eukprot:XP_003385416.1 PREDICTED: origin recognition complex subunit 2-like [Amphimedon queenslandica]
MSSLSCRRPQESENKSLRSGCKRRRVQHSENESPSYSVDASQDDSSDNSSEAQILTPTPPSPLPVDENECPASDGSDAELEMEPDQLSQPIFTSTFNPLAPLSGFTGSVDQHCVTEDIVESYFARKTVGNQKVEMYPNIDESLRQEYLGVESDSFDLFDVYRGLFEYWHCQLKSGFNVLLHGIGSKIKLLSEFRSTCLSNCHLMVVYGFFPALSLKEILNTVTSDIFEHSGHFKSLTEQCKFICSLLCDKKSSVKELFLLIHNIDGRSLQDKKMQEVLSLLVTCPSIHIIASTDHPRASLLWDEITMSRFNWVWHHTPTYESYDTELSYDKSGTFQRSDALVISSFNHVMSSLTPNARGVFQVLANVLLEHKDDTTFSGLSFTELYQKCRERFLVSSDVSLRAQLTEFKDHKLIQFKKGQDGTEILTIPFKLSIVEQLIDAQ